MESKIISFRLNPDDPSDLSLIQFLSRGSAADQIRALWKSVTEPKTQKNGQLANHIYQLRHAIERCDSDLLLMKMTEEEYTDTLKSIESAIRHLEGQYL